MRRKRRRTTQTGRSQTCTFDVHDGCDPDATAFVMFVLRTCRCQQALETRSADAVDAAYQAASQAEEAAASAATRGASAAAHAAIKQREAERHSQAAAGAADLSAPHGAAAKVQAWWGQGRRATQQAVRHVGAAGSAVAGAAGAAAEGVRSAAPRMGGAARAAVVVMQHALAQGRANAGAAAAVVWHNLQSNWVRAAGWLAGRR